LEIYNVYLSFPGEMMNIRMEQKDILLVNQKKPEYISDILVQAPVGHITPKKFVNGGFNGN